MIQDTVGAMFTNNTETNITATYQDSDGTDLIADANGVTVEDDGIVLANAEQLDFVGSGVFWYGSN